MIASKIPAAINPYSIAVAPDSSLMKSRRIRVIAMPPSRSVISNPTTVAIQTVAIYVPDPDPMLPER
jgi:hypothetical protein